MAGSKSKQAVLLCITYVGNTFRTSHGIQSKLNNIVLKCFKILDKAFFLQSKASFS